MPKTKRAAPTDSPPTDAPKPKKVKTETNNSGIVSRNGRFVFFYGNTFIFSQFHPAKFKVDGIEYNCMEQYMHHQKAVLFKDDDIAKKIMATTVPLEHKRLGRRVQNFDKAVWKVESVNVVKKGSEAKYLQNEEMKKALFDTHPKILVEASPRDRLWGIGLGASNPSAENPGKWRGLNLLGATLTDVRNKMMATEGLIPEEKEVGISTFQKAQGMV